MLFHLQSINVWSWQFIKTTMRISGSFQVFLLGAPKILWTIEDEKDLA
jgi:hypothetical protein